MEKLLDAIAPVPQIVNRKSQIVNIQDVRPAHFAAIKRLVDFKLIAKSKVRVAHDALFGVGAGVFETLLAKTSCHVTTLNGAHDILFGGICPEPLPKNYALGSAQLRRHPHDICLVTDGDADRIGAMDGRGGPMTNQQVIALLLHHLVRNRGGRGVVTKTYNTTAMVDKMCAAWNLPLTEVGIGFRFIAPELMKPGALFGAEESGSVGFANHIPERDGLAAGLFLLEMLAMEKISVNRIYARLEQEFGPHRYAEIRRALSAGAARRSHGPTEGQSAGKIAPLTARQGGRARRREICGGGFQLADAARLRDGTGPAHLRRGQERRGRAEALEAGPVAAAKLTQGQLDLFKAGLGC